MTGVTGLWIPDFLFVKKDYGKIHIRKKTWNDNHLQ